MNKKLILSIFVLAEAPILLSTTGEARLLHFPTTDGKEIVSLYTGDLYKTPAAGDEAQRLTSHVGYEMFPRFSPNGKTIAFTGQYDGNVEVYTIPVTGGELLRVTHTATNSCDDLGDRMGPSNIIIIWTPDGQRIAYRNRISDRFSGKLFTVDKEGGLSEAIPLPGGGFYSYSPDGKQLTYNRVMHEFRTWKHYKGGMTDDIWVYNPNSKTMENITNNVAQDIFPMRIGDEISFLSDRDRIMNIFIYSTRTKQTAKITDFTEYDVKFPSASGNTIVSENGGYIYKMGAATRKAEKISIALASDNIYTRTDLKDGANYVTTASLSPNGARMVMTSRGEVFNLPVERRVTKNITHSPGAHDRDTQWSPDGTQIAYISDVTGEAGLCLQNAAGGKPMQLTHKNDTCIRDFKWSSNSKKMVYMDRKNRVNLLDMTFGRVSLLLQDSVGVPDGVTFSPDSEWLTYTRMGKNEIGVVYVYNIAEKKKYPVTNRRYNSSSPVFSTDGKYLVFSPVRDFNPTYGSLEWNHIYNNMYDVYIALLSKDTSSPFVQKDAEVAVSNTTPKDGDKKPADKKEMANVPLVKFDPGGITDRIVCLPLSPSYYGSFYSDGDKVYYWGHGGTKMYDLTSQKEESIADGASMDVTYGGEKALFFKGHQVYVISLPSGKTKLTAPVDLSNMRITVDYPKEWAQIFDEAWRAYRDGFYQESTHGVDQEAVKEEYAVLLPYVKTRLGLNYVTDGIIGELNCGHAYVNPGEMEQPKRINTGLLGTEITRDRSGFFHLGRIFPGASWNKGLRSPLTESGVDVRTGEYIIAIDGVSTNTVKNMYSLLVGKAEIPTEISLSTRPWLSGARKVVISPLANKYPLIHYNWVQDDIGKMDQASNGRIGYIYVPGTGPEGLNEFAHYFYPQLDKEGLIIDDRVSGGSNVSPMILECLSREPYRLTMGRGTSHVGAVPDVIQVGPKVCLINKYSASDGDLFPWGFRALGLGKLIGTRTWGGIVGTSNSLSYMDGIDIRVPFFTSYDSKTGQWIIENHGVDPDVLIDNNPMKEWNGEDQQLNRAIEEVMKQLQDHKPLIPVPVPRDFSK